MQTTAYFREIVLKKCPYLDALWCERVLTDPVCVRRQGNGRMRFWGFVPELGRFLRVVTLADGVTVHNAFPDRNFENNP